MADATSAPAPGTPTSDCSGGLQRDAQIVPDPGADLLGDLADRGEQHVRALERGVIRSQQGVGLLEVTLSPLIREVHVVGPASQRFADAGQGDHRGCPGRIGHAADVTEGQDQLLLGLDQRVEADHLRVEDGGVARHTALGLGGQDHGHQYCVRRVGPILDEHLLELPVGELDAHVALADSQEDLPEPCLESLVFRRYH